ncbi:MAG: hypothetical protein CVU11_05065 [Bacteroidetes bacterium HGW-Bacteroidetes-6]|jgi:hypothetical protein|nr:MAG: hypothetical protein CVU11_05065 [Bacteroidetes bacterium HGW-Bacteroidetes-6]
MKNVLLIICVSSGLLVNYYAYGQLSYCLGSGIGLSNFKADSIETSPRLGFNINLGAKSELDETISFITMISFTQHGAKATNGRVYSDTGFSSEVKEYKFYYTELGLSILANYYLKYPALSVQGGIKMGLTKSSYSRNQYLVCFGNSANPEDNLTSSDFEYSLSKIPCSYAIVLGAASGNEEMQVMLNYSLYFANSKSNVIASKQYKVHKSLIELKVLFFIG